MQKGLTRPRPPPRAATPTVQRSGNRRVSGERENIPVYEMNFFLSPRLSFMFPKVPVVTRIKACLRPSWIQYISSSSVEPSSKTRTKRAPTARLTKFFIGIEIKAMRLTLSRAHLPPVRTRRAMEARSPLQRQLLITRSHRRGVSWLSHSATAIDSLISLVMCLVLPTHPSPTILPFTTSSTAPAARSHQNTSFSPLPPLTPSVSGSIASSSLHLTPAHT